VVVYLGEGKDYGIFLQRDEDAVLTPYDITLKRMESALKVRDMLNEAVDKG
jgi:hypothetical protein